MSAGVNAYAPPDRECAHPELLLDRGSSLRAFDGGGTDKDKEKRKELLTAVCESLAKGQALETYRRVIAARRLDEERAPGDTLRWTCVVRTTSRLLLHPASNATVTEGSVLLHHTYGTPYVPGSALKAAARHAFGARGQATVKDGDLDLKQVEWLFGAEKPDVPAYQEDARRDLASLFEFHDALWLPPEPGAPSPLELDVVTPHHSDYYTSAALTPPAEWDSPIPTTRLTVRAGVEFLLCIDCPPGPGNALGPWLEFVGSDLLLSALAFDGVGSRTTSGYGRMSPVGRPQPTRGWAGQPATSSSTRASGTSAAPQQTEDTYDLKWTPGNRTLVASHQGKEIARAAGEIAAELVKGLPDEIAGKLAKQKAVRARVRWTKVGNGGRIEAVTPG